MTAGRTAAGVGVRRCNIKCGFAVVASCAAMTLLPKPVFLCGIGSFQH